MATADVRQYTGDGDGHEPVPASPRYCEQIPPRVRELPADLTPGRARAILSVGSKWINGTVLRYAFFGRGLLAVPEEQRAVVRQAFADWKALGIGLDFKELDDLAESEIRIGFSDDGSWSYVGRDVLTIPSNEPTMNFGWDLTRGDGPATARHEIGHTLGLQHEHQNPFAGIVWNEEAVYASLGQPPNNWPRETTFHNILRKLDRTAVAGSNWDPDSIMEYPFEAGLIKEPAAHRNGVNPPGTLSAADKQWALKWYPAQGPAAPPVLQPFQSVPLNLKPAEQRDFTLTPSASRTYKVGTFGTADTLLVLFESTPDGPKYLAGDDDSGTDRNAEITVRLRKGRTYIARLRLYWAGASGSTAIMHW